MDKKKTAVTVIATLVMFYTMAISIWASSNEYFYLPKNQIWTYRRAVSRTGKYTYASASLDAVYPQVGTDTYERIQTRLVNESGKLIMTSDYVVLKEGEGYKNLQIKEGWLDKKTIYIQFRGNSNADAEAIVNYKGN